MEEFNLEGFLAGCSDEYHLSIDNTTMDIFEELVDYISESWIEEGISDETLEGFDYILVESGLEVIDSQTLWEINPSLAIAYENVKDNLLVSCVAQKAAKKIMNGGSCDPDKIFGISEAIDYIRECQRANKFTGTPEIDDKGTKIVSGDKEQSRYIAVGEDYHTVKNQTTRAYGNVMAVHEKATEELSLVKKK